jgi:hypothetical protein
MHLVYHGRKVKQPFCESQQAYHFFFGFRQMATRPVQGLNFVNKTVAPGAFLSSAWASMLTSQLHAASPARYTKLSKTAQAA